MKNACWALFGFSVVLFLVGVYAKAAGGQGNFPLDFQPVAWWRAAMALLLYAIGLKIIGGEGTSTA